MRSGVPNQLLIYRDDLSRLSMVALVRMAARS
jgi:hypothetical protein